MAKKTGASKALVSKPATMAEQLNVAAEVAALLSQVSGFVDYDAASDYSYLRAGGRRALAVGGDSSASNVVLWEDSKAAGTSPADGRHIGDLNPAMRCLMPVDFYRASWYPLGAFMCHVMPRLAFRNEWRFVKQKDTKEGVERKLAEKLALITRKWRIRLVAMAAVETAATFGRSLVFKVENAQPGRRSRPGLRVCPIEEEYIEYTENEITRFRPMVAWGKNGLKQLDLDPADCVLFVHNPDPLGNTYEGIPAHFGAYKTIIRKERVTRAYANLIENRGMGLLLAAIKAGNFTVEDMKKWGQQFGNPGSRNVLFFPQQVMDIQAVPGINTGFDYVGTDASFTRHGSMATGEPGQRMEGTQTGMVTGGKTDQDNTAEIYAMFHEMHEDAILDIYTLVEPGLKDAQFELMFPNDIEMDALEKSNMFQRNVASVLEAAPLITVEKGCMMIDAPVPEDAEPTEILAKYLNRKQLELTPAPGDPGYNDWQEYENGKVPASQKAQLEQKEQQQSNGKPGQKGFKAKNDHAKRPNMKTAKDSMDPAEWIAMKEEMARPLLAKMPYEDIDTVLNCFFGESLDRNRLAEMRKGK